MSEEAGPSDELIAVGVSQTSHSPVALGWAAEEAKRHDADLLAVRAWRPSRPPSTAAGRPPATTRDLERERADAEQALQDDVAQALGPGHPARCEVRDGTPLAVLNEVSATADLLVLDAPRRTDFKTTPMLAHRLVYQASCPVVIMPPRIAEQPETPLVQAGRKVARGVTPTSGSRGTQTGSGTAPEQSGET